MARVGQAGRVHLRNYFRWFAGAPEAPFLVVHSVFGWLAQVNLSSPWLRLPALLCGIAVADPEPRGVLPAPGRAAACPIVGATAAAAFLAMWFPFDNGLRP